MTDPTSLSSSQLWLAILFIGMIAFAFGVGIWAGRRISEPPRPTDEQIAKYMGKVVNQEEMEEHQRLLKFRMARNGRQTQRFDSGPNAKIMRLKIRPVSRRFRK